MAQTQKQMIAHKYNLKIRQLAGMRVRVKEFIGDSIDEHTDVSGIIYTKLNQIAELSNELKILYATHRDQVLDIIDKEKRK